MLLILSPSKTLDFETPRATEVFSQSPMLNDSMVLIKELRRYAPEKLMQMMGISEKLATLNVQRYHGFFTPFTLDNARQALLAFKGDVYEGIDVENYSKKDFTFAQEHVRILSGLYGLLRPLDLIQPYRLEMGTRLANPRGKDLYTFWDDNITQAINETLKTHKNQLLVNLASEEYFKAVRPKKLSGELLNIVFKEKKGDTLKIIGLFAKQARGKMANFIIKNQLQSAAALKDFNEGGYAFSDSHSNAGAFVFIR